jgi:arginyl-tRNA synthetase
MIKTTLEGLVNQAVIGLIGDSSLAEGSIASVQLERTRDRAHGDFATGVAMRLASVLKRKPRDIAEELVRLISERDHTQIIRTLEIAGPGFINVFLREGVLAEVVQEILEHKEAFGQLSLDAPCKIHLEFVSANPTGPLHVGHGRGAACGASLTNLLRTAGYQVHAEYYVNDAGRQMDILATSVWLRYLEQCGVEFDFPVNGYKGEYIREISAQLNSDYQERFLVSGAALFEGVPADEPNGGDKELHIDAKTLLGDAGYQVVFAAGIEAILGDIRQDLEEFGVVYDNWYSEQSLTHSGALDNALNTLEEKGYLKEVDGALWFESTRFGDEKDRVVRRENGLNTYFASDIAYHKEKMEQGYDLVLDIWGADHHGYIPRVKGALQAFGLDSEKMKVLLVQFAILYRGSERVQMSTRSGEFVTLRELRNEVGNDAARFFYVMRKPEQHLDFDLELAKKQSNDNPVYYIQYAHARVSQILRRLSERGLQFDAAMGLANLNTLTAIPETELIDKISAFPETIQRAAASFEPHQMCGYLKELATLFHAYYQQKDEALRVIHPDSAIRNARLALCLAVQQVLRNGLAIVGVSAPEEM